jgi:levanase
VSELSTLYVRAPKVLTDKPISGSTSAGIKGATLDLDETFAPGSAKQFGIDVHVGNGQRTRIGYDRASGTVFIDRTESGAVSFDPSFGGVQSAPLRLRHGHLHLRILVDTSSVEVFADKGQVVLTDQVFPDPTSNGVELFAVGGTATLVSGTGRHVRSIWP